MKLYLLVLLITLLIPACGAYSLSEVSIIPPGPVVAGNPVTATFQINISTYGYAGFPEGNVLQLVTDLDNANWTYWINIDGIGNLQPREHGRVLQLTSWELTYRTNVVRETVRVLLEGNAPKITSTQNKVIFDIMELAPSFNMVPKSETQYTALIVNPSDIKNGVISLTNELQGLRTEINNKSSLGADVSKAEEKYSIAQQEILTAQNCTTDLYLDAIYQLTDVEKTITLGLKDLDDAWMQKQVSDQQAEQARVAAQMDSESRSEKLKIIGILGLAFVVCAGCTGATIIRYTKWKKAQKKDEVVVIQK